MDPSVWFIIGSLMIGMAFAKTGLTRRMAFRMLAVIPEKHQDDLPGRASP